MFGLKCLTFQQEFPSSHHTILIKLKHMLQTTIGPKELQLLTSQGLL